MSASDRIEYPNQLKPITDDLRDDELVKRLKALSLTLQEMGQDEDVFTNYVPLALHLARDFFLQHESKDVQLLVACSIADVLRVFAPEAPYKDPDHVKTIFLFLIRQLNGLKDPKDPAFKRYFYLCENLAYVKSFNMCFELVDCQEIFCALFTLIFRIVNDEHSQKVKSFMLEILVPLISESDSISPELLDIILVNVIEPYKTQRKNAYALAKELIKKTSDSLSIYVQSFLNDALISDKPDKNLTSSKRIYDLIYELNVISPSLLLSVLPQLECKIKAVQESERLKAVSLLARMFSEKDSNLSKQHNGLLNHFLGRFLDIAVAIRIKCVQSTMHFLVNHPSLRADIIQVLNGRQHDSDEMVRFEVVNSIVETAKRDYKVVSESQELMGILKERSQDKKFKIRRAAMNGLALIYNKYLTAVIANEEVAEEHLEAAKWIQIRILNGYYNATLDDQLLIERLVITHLVPYQLPANDRMKALYKLLATIDDHALKAFVELQKNQIKHKKNVLDWVKLHRHKETPESKKEIYKKATIILKLFPDPFKSEEFLTKFSGHLRQDRRMMMDMDTILKRDVECKECADAMTNILKKLGTPIMTNIYYNTIKILLSRIASVMIDKEGIEVLIHLIEGQLQQINHPKVANEMDEEHLMKENNLLDSLNLKPEDTSARGLNLLTVLIYLFPAHFLHESVLRPMASLLSFEFDFVSASIFKALTHLGRFKPLIESHPGVLEDLAPICKDFAIKGTPKQAKHALRCLFVNSQCAQLDMDAEEQNSHQKQVKTRIDNIFQEIVDATNNSLTPSSPNYRTAIVCFGHIAYNLPERFNIPLKNIVSRKIVKELLISKLSDKRTKISEDDWCDEDDLAEELRCRVEGLKAIARWLVGLKDNVLAAQKTFRMLFAFIGKDGDILEQGVMTPAEKSWMRLSAGNAMLKICEQKGVGDEYNAEQFLTLSSLLNDPVLKVRELFLKKLHKGLYKGIPHKCLPLDFMGFYVLAGREVDKKLREQLKNNYEIDVNHRREYVKTFSNGGIEGAISQLSNILPDYIVPFAIAILAHSNLFQDRTNIEQLKLVEKCLNFILEPLINSKETFCFSLYTNMIQRMKHSKSAYKSDNQEINEKLWTICDMALHIILTKLKTVDMREYTLEQVCIPTMYYQEQLPTFNNKRDYLSQEYKRLTAAKNADGTDIAKTSVATMQPSTAAKRTNLPAPSQRIKRQKNDVIS